MEQSIIELSRAGTTDKYIAAQLTTRGYRSPMSNIVLPSTVRNIRLKHGIMVKRSQSHPRNIPGYLTIGQLTKQVDISAHWVYDRINNGTIQIVKDAETRLYLFPDKPETLQMFRDLKTGQLQILRF
jgi:hypothetical protein